MTSKSLKRARHKAALKQKEVSAPVVAAGPAPRRRDWSRVVSEAMVAGRWQNALEGLVSMRREGQVPKLGSVQRWVRLADLSGEEQLAARLLDAIMRTTSSSVTAAPGGLIVSSGFLPDVSTATKEEPQPESAGGSAGGIAPTAAKGTPATEEGGMGSVKHDPASAPTPADSALLPPLQLVGVVRRHPPWVPPAPPGIRRGAAEGGCSTSAEAAKKRCEGRVHVVGHDQGGNQVGALANPIFMTDPNLIHFNPRGVIKATDHEGHPAAPRGTAQRDDNPAETSDPSQEGDGVGRVDVPFVPGAFVLTGVLSREEAAQIIAVSERMGYSQDADYAFSAPEKGSGSGSRSCSVQGGPSLPDVFLEPVLDADHGDTDPGTAADTSYMSGSGSGSSSVRAGGGQLSAARASAGGERAAGCVWLADESLLSPVWERVRRLLPPQIGGCRLKGINARWRLYRYDQGTVYRPHVDGAWPGSGLRDGKVLFDAFGDRWSRLTFLLYLNDGFEGGSTTFYTPGHQEGILEARGVSPRCGNVLVFPHGDTMGSLVHEGSAVTAGVKYVIRSDVLYETRKTEPRASRPEDRGGGSNGSSVKKHRSN